MKIFNFFNKNNSYQKHRLLWEEIALIIYTPDFIKILNDSGNGFNIAYDLKVQAFNNVSKMDIFKNESEPLRYCYACQVQDEYMERYSQGISSVVINEENRCLLCPIEWNTIGNYCCNGNSLYVQFSQALYWCSSNRLDYPKVYAENRKTAYHKAIEISRLEWLSYRDVVDKNERKG